MDSCGIFPVNGFHVIRRVEINIDRYIQSADYLDHIASDSADLTTIRDEP